MMKAYKTIPMLCVIGLCSVFAAEKDMGGHSMHASGDMQPSMQHHKAMLSSTKLTLSEEIMNAMHEPMMEVPFVSEDNIDFNFISNMIPHHQGAIDSSKLILQHSKNTKIRQIAQNIIKVQEAEIEEFKALLPLLKEQKQLYSPKESTLYNKQAKEDMETMEKAMSEIPLAQRVEHDFLMGMISHHQGAVESSKLVLRYTQNESIKAIAQRIVDSQSEEIEYFYKLLQTKAFH